MLCDCRTPAVQTPDESVSPAVGTYSHRFQTATLALLPSEHGSAAATVCAAALSGSGLSELLLMCHHPAITAGVAKKRATWETAARRLQGCVVTTLKSGWPTVVVDWDEAGMTYLFAVLRRHKSSRLQDRQAAAGTAS